MSYDPTKEYQTRDGREVKLIDELDHTGSLVGMCRDGAGDWIFALWNGETLRHRSGIGAPKSNLDLVEKPKTHVRWLHLVEHRDGGVSSYIREKRLTGFAFGGTTIAVKRVEIAEGEGLEDEH